HVSADQHLHHNYATFDVSSHQSTTHTADVRVLSTRADAVSPHEPPSTVRSPSLFESCFLTSEKHSHRGKLALSHFDCPPSLVGESTYLSSRLSNPSHRCASSMPKSIVPEP